MTAVHLLSAFAISTVIAFPAEAPLAPPECPSDHRPASETVASAVTLEREAQACRIQGLHARAESLLTSSIRIRENVEGTRSSELIPPLVVLGNLYQDHAQYMDAEKAYLRALDIAETASREEQHIMAILDRLGTVYRVQGREAGPLYERAVTIAEKQYGKNDGRVSTLLNNYAVFEKSRGRYSAAESLGKRALEISKQAMGPESPGTAIVYSNLGQIARASGNQKKARALFERAIRLWERSLGPMHPDVARGLGNLAVLLTEMKKYKQAAALYQRALAINEARSRVSIETARALNNFGSFFSIRGEYSDAQPLLERSLKIFRDIAPKSPDTAKILNNLAGVRSRLGAPEEAEKLYKEALAIWDSGLDNQSSDVLPAIEALSALFRKSERYAEAEKLDLRATRIRVKRAIVSDQERSDSRYSIDK